MRPWLVPLIPAILQAEIGVPGLPGQKVKPPSQINQSKKGLEAQLKQKSTYLANAKS
jgi:hypothetical protein